MSNATATKAAIHLDIKKNRARQYAFMLIHELVEGGYIPSRCRKEAEWHLAEMFYKNDVEITTAEQRDMGAT